MEWMPYIAGIGVCITIILTLPRFWKWWRPLHVSAGCTRDFVARREQIDATITNLTDKDQVLIVCVARPMRPFRYALFSHLRRPIASWRLRQNVWFAGQSFNFLANDETLRLLPGEQKTLAFRLNLESPLHQFMAREFVIEVQLSNRRTFRSKRLSAPDKWLLRPKVRFSKEDGWVAEQSLNADGVPLVIHVPFKGKALSERYIHMHAYTALHDKCEKLKQMVEKSN